MTYGHHTVACSGVSLTFAAISAALAAMCFAGAALLGTIAKSVETRWTSRTSPFASVRLESCIIFPLSAYRACPLLESSRERRTSSLKSSCFASRAGGGGSAVKGDWVACLSSLRHAFLFHHLRVGDGLVGVRRRAGS